VCTIESRSRGLACGRRMGHSFALFLESSRPSPIKVSLLKSPATMIDI